MARITVEESAARVEEMAQGPVLNLDDQPSPGDGDPIPTGPDPKVLQIWINAPGHGEQLHGSLSAGVPVTVHGAIEPPKGYHIKEVRVRFGNLPSQVASLDPNSGWGWSATSKDPVRTAGGLGIHATVFGTDPNGVQKKESTGRQVHIILNDDVAPTVKILTPAGTFASPTLITRDADKQYWASITASASDPSGIASMEHWDNWESVWNDMKRPPGAVNWTAKTRLQYSDFPQAVRVHATDGNDNPASATTWVRTRDTTAPTVKIKGDSAISIPGQAPAGAILAELKGTASDWESGVAKVQWGLNLAPGASPSTPVTSVSGKHSAAWKLERVALPMGANRITVRATDVAGNVSAQAEVLVSVTEQYQPKDPTVHEYYSSLIDFIAHRLRYKGAAVNADKLTEVLYQPFLRLKGAGPEQPEVSQLRIGIEVLDQHLGKLAAPSGGAPSDQATGDPPLPGDQPGQQATAARAKAFAGYRQLAYQAILRRLGTSAEELRATLRGDLATRRALAERLGIDLDEEPVREGQVRNNLQPFLLTPAQTAGAELERLFGLVSFDRDPLAEPDTDPVLLDLQLQRLVATWREPDWVALGVLVDPDVISGQNLQPGANPATKLYQARQGWLDGLLADLRATAPATEPPARFELLVTPVLGAVKVLVAIAERQALGEDVTADLDRLQLTFPAFQRLMAVRRLAAAKSVTEEEWEDVYAILIQVHKLRALEAWREAERGAGLALSPAYFQPGDVEREGPAVSPWRATRGARRRWRTILQGHAEQQQALRQALLSTVAAAEEETLPGLRDALMLALSPLTPASSGALSKRLMIDVMTGGAVRVTRVEQAIQTLQSLLVGVRTGDAADWSRIGSESQEDFDEELKWIGSYANWYAAMQVFLFPENHLHPALRPDEPGDKPSAKFKQLVKNLRTSQQLTHATALGYAEQFDDAEFGPNLVFPRTPAQLQARTTKIKNAVTAATTAVGGAPANTNLLRLGRLAKEANPGLREKFYFVPMAIALQLHKAGQYLAALDWFRLVYAYDLPVAARKVYHPLELERDPNPSRKLVYERNVFWLAKTLNAHDIVDESYPLQPGQSENSARYDVHTRFVVASIVRCLLDFADAEFIQDTNESLPRARSLYLQALELLALPELNPAKVAELTPNEVITGLARRAQIALAKLRTGRNFAGLVRQLETVTPLTGAGGTALVAGGGPFGSSSLRALQPTPYRYATLIERAKHLVGIAQQVEQSYLAALEKRDAEDYNLFKARQDLQLANANVELQTFRAAEAASSVTLAQRQQERATYQADAYQDLLDAPMNHWERELLDDYGEALRTRNAIAGIDAALTISQVIQSASSLEKAISPGAAVAAGAAAGFAAIKGILTVDLNNIETDIQRHSLHASIENRVRDWTLQQGVARRDEAVGAAGVQVAVDHEAIVLQEGRIARLQVTQAEATVAFLVNKFTNVELYDWMIEVLRDVYGYFLHQATAVAQLAQRQLAFESQQPTPGFVRKDYWQPSEGFGLTDDAGPDRRGLTGSARLLQDIYQLDQFAFETSKRKLHLTKTISLARLAPAEFQRFRRTGVLIFATPMALFDQDFPGHYLRLIRRVRTSMVALVPPNQGIRATLTNAGVSRVVVGGDSFQTVRLTRDPESVALTSSSNATGVFELDTQPEMLLPFELSGVDSVWSLELPAAANPFDYRTIADVLVTLEYTALSNGDYRQKVIQQLDRTVQASRAYSVRDQLPDAWYDLHNPPRPEAPARVDVTVGAGDFPSNLDAVTTTQLAVYVVFAEDVAGTPVRASLTFARAGRDPAPVSGEATSTTDGIISTRLGNAAAWVPMLNQAPFGTWQLTFREAAKLRSLLASQAVTDIVLVLSYSAQTPAWPE